MADETVKVRVAVAVDCNGNYASSGWKMGDELSSEWHADTAGRNLMSRGQGQAVYYLTAELPIPKRPEPAEVAAGVDEVKP
jgi:hypothetical protein